MRLVFKCCAVSTLACIALCAICFILFFKHEIHGVSPTPYFIKHGNKTNGTFRVYFNNNTQNATNMDRKSCDCDAFECWQQHRMQRWAISFPVPVARENDKYALGLTQSERNCWLQNTTLLPLSDLDAFHKNDCRDSHIVLVSASKDRGGHQLFRETRRRYANAHNYSFFHCYSKELLLLHPLGNHHAKSICLLHAFIKNPKAHWLLWTDDDVAVNPRYLYVPLAFFMQTIPNSEFSWVMSNEGGTNTGVFFVRRNNVGWGLLHSWMDVSLQKIFTFSDQHSFRSIIADTLFEKNKSNKKMSMKYASCVSKQGWTPSRCDETFVRMLAPVLPNFNKHTLDEIPSNSTRPFYFLQRSINPQLALGYGMLKSDAAPRTLFLHPAGYKGVDLKKLFKIHRPLINEWNFENWHVNKAPNSLRSKRIHKQ